MVACELATTTARELGVPFVLVQGEDDMVTPTSVALPYFEACAPVNTRRLIPHAGHFAIVTDREALLRRRWTTCSRGSVEVAADHALGAIKR